MQFFLNKDNKQEYEKKHGKIEDNKPKRSYTPRSTSSRSKKSLNDLSSSSHKPIHFDNKLKFIKTPTGKLLQSLCYFTKDGIRLGLIYEYHTQSSLIKYEVKLLDVDFKVLKEEVLEDINSCRQYLSLLPETIEIEDPSGLLHVIKDVLKKIGQLDKEVYFMFRLLIDPEEREQYSIINETKNDIKQWEDTQKKIKKLDQRPKSTHRKSKKKENDVLLKLGDDLRNKIKGLQGMKK